MDAIEKFNQYLYLSDQLEFKSWARYHGLAKSKGADFYFDNIHCVDATKPEQPTIPYVTADGTIRWGDALHCLKSYFKI